MSVCLSVCLFVASIAPDAAKAGWARWYVGVRGRPPSSIGYLPPRRARRRRRCAPKHAKTALFSTDLGVSAEVAPEAGEAGRRYPYGGIGDRGRSPPGHLPPRCARRRRRCALKHAKMALFCTDFSYFRCHANSRRSRPAVLVHVRVRERLRCALHAMCACASGCGARCARGAPPCTFWKRCTKCSLK